MLRIISGILLMGVLSVFASGGLAESRTITAVTEVTKWGQLPVCFEIEGQTLPEGVGPELFTISGDAASWGSEATHPFRCGVREVAPGENGWTLVPDAFPEKYFYVRRMEVACEGHPELSFTLEDIGRTVTPVADDFTTVEEKAARLNARVFTPDSAEPCPVVIVFHGYGDTDNLLTYRTSVAWAEPSAQAVRPCLVVSPVIDSLLYPSDKARAKIFGGVMDLVDKLVGEGKADPDRIYAVGNSFGGMSALELAEQYPDRIAAVLALCPALNYSPGGTARLPELTETPVFIAQAENDETIPSDVGRSACTRLAEAGNPNVRIRIYTDGEMEAAGARFGSSETYSFHHVELAVMEDESYAEWLFSQRRNHTEE